MIDLTATDLFPIHIISLLQLQAAKCEKMFTSATVIIQSQRYQGFVTGTVLYLPFGGKKDRCADKLLATSMGVTANR